ncbi:hypothetical protein PGQ11_001516 [Apiospora arundinis]|uniref:Uncharacterized protein n=1 Tax=Apiospora arundinis TaxID=335852 RepID=A0ABR2JN41_9PEZI
MPSRLSLASSSTPIAAVRVHGQSNSDFLRLFHVDGSVFPVLQPNQPPEECNVYMLYYLPVPAFNIRASEDRKEEEVLSIAAMDLAAGDAESGEDDPSVPHSQQQQQSEPPPTPEGTSG